jgi:hypothetical protein
MYVLKYCGTLDVMKEARALPLTKIYKNYA